VLRRGEQWKRGKEVVGQPQADLAGVQGVVWGHAAFHKAKVVGEVGLRRIYQPPYSPELNPAEQVFAAVRQWVEGRRYERIEAKKAAVEAVLRRLEAERKVSSLVGRRHIRQASNALPS
jgi:transposase